MSYVQVICPKGISLWCGRISGFIGKERSCQKNIGYFFQNIHYFSGNNRLFDLFNTSSLLILLTGGITETYNASQLALMNQEEYERSSVFITYTNSLIQMSLFSYTLKYMKQHLDLDDKHIILMNLVLNAYLTLICFNAIGMNPGFDSIYRMANALWVAYPFCIVFTIYVFIKKKLKLIALAIFILSFYIKYNTMPFMRPKSETYYLFVPYKSFLDQNQPIRSGYWYY